MPSCENAGYPIQITYHVKRRPVLRISSCFATSFRVRPVMIAMRERDILRSSIWKSRAATSTNTFFNTSASSPKETPFRMSTRQGLDELAVGGKQTESKGICHRKKAVPSAKFGRATVNRAREKLEGTAIG